MIDPTDKSTVISLFPLPILEEKPGIFPGRFHIEPAGDSPSLLVVGQSIHYVDVGEDRPQLTVTTSSAQIAQSIVEDFIAAQLGVDDDRNVRPGITWVRGEVTPITLKTKYTDIVAGLQTAHRAWYAILVKMGDDDWQRYRKHSVISEIQRIAASKLGFTDREWLVVDNQLQHKTCPACGTSVAPVVVVCPSCRCVLDKVKYDQLAFAK
jgi:hypothetical protein